MGRIKEGTTTLAAAVVVTIPSLALPQKSLETFLLPLEKKTKRPSFFGKMQRTMKKRVKILWKMMGPHHWTHLPLDLPD
jgi:hypothetical protein